VNSGTGNEFWQEYAFAMQLGGMPAHCRYGLDNFRRLGGSSMLSKMMDSTLRAKTIQTDPDISHSNQALWQSMRNGAKISFMSRPLGMKIQVDSSWNMGLNGYARRLTAVTIEPDMAVSPKGKKIGYTIGVVVRAAEEGEQLKDFMTSMMKMGGDKDAAFPFGDIYPGGLSYTLKSDKFYSDRGGARIHYIGIERSSPTYPGLSLEDQASELGGEPGKMNFYTQGIIRMRMPGKIFYFFILDTCNDIHQESWDTFQRLIKGMKLD
jgi:hypothetical protein